MNKHNFDLIYLHYLYSLQYIPQKVKCPVVLDQQNVDRDLWLRKFYNRTNPPLLRLFSLINAYKTVRFEAQHWKSIRAYISVSEQDAADTKSYAGRWVNQFLIAPNGININAFSGTPRRETPPKKIVLGFLGSMNLAINQHAVRELLFEILPEVNNTLSDWDVSILIVGKDPPRTIIDLASLDRRVRITGTVPNVVDYLYQMDIMVLPLREGGGSKLRVLEGMAAGLPIIGTNLAFIGLDGLEHDENCCYANTTGEMVRAICDLAQNPTKRRRIGWQAKRLVLRKYSWEEIARHLSQELQTISLSAEPG